MRRCASLWASVSWSFGASPRGSTLAAYSVSSSTNRIASSSVDGWYTSWRRSRSFVVQKCSGRDSAQFSSQSSMYSPPMFTTCTASQCRAHPRFQPSALCQLTPVSSRRHSMTPGCHFFSCVCQSSTSAPCSKRSRLGAPPLRSSGPAGAELDRLRGAGGGAGGRGVTGSTPAIGEAITTVSVCGSTTRRARALHIAHSRREQCLRGGHR